MKFQQNGGKIGTPKTNEIPEKMEEKLEFQKKIHMKFQKMGEKIGILLVISKMSLSGAHFQNEPTVGSTKGSANIIYAHM